MTHSFNGQFNQMVFSGIRAKYLINTVYDHDNNNNIIMIHRPEVTPTTKTTTLIQHYDPRLKTIINYNNNYNNPKINKDNK